jgi:5-formyltetrahydrofolate cyclo-ligase
LLAEVRGHKCGVAFDAQIVAEVPEELHDVRVNSILTPTRWHLCLRAA